MDNTQILYSKIDLIIEEIDKYKKIEKFNIEWNIRQNKKVSNFKSDSDILKRFSYLIAYSQNAKSENVGQVLNSGFYDKAFENFDIEKVKKLNPCDIADNHWEQIKGIRQQSKLFHIVTLARKIKRIGGFYEFINDLNIPKEINNYDDIENFWIGFERLQKKLTEHKISFFQSTTSLLHFLLDCGYDCVKPDLVVMKVAQKLNIVDLESGNKNFIKTVRTIQEYCVDRKIRPTIVDFYFLIEGKQSWAVKFVNDEFYK
jgi:hypothetical protein